MKLSNQTPPARSEVEECLRKELLKAGAWYAAFVVLAFAGFGYRLLSARPDSYQASYVSTRILEANHRLGEADFEPPKGIPGALALSLPNSKRLIGRYLMKRIPKKGDPIPADVLSPQPVVRADPGKVAYVVPLSEQAGALEWLDAGTSVQVLGASSSFPASVLAICCEKPADPKTCSALIAAPAPADPCSPRPEDSPAKWRLMPPAALTPACISWATPTPPPAPTKPVKKD